MTTKKSSTKKQTKTKPTRKADGSYDSYALTDEEIARMAEGYAFDFTNNSGPNDDGPALDFLILLYSFTYTLDHARREAMMRGVEKEFFPFLTATDKALSRASAERFRELTKEGGAN
jgi:hypothetical protein